MKHTYIYALVNPEDDSVFYVGKANRLQARLANHLSLSDSDGNRHKKNKIKKIKQRGFLPELKVLEKCLQSEWKSREKHWIAYGRSNGWPLTNIVNGGEGATWNYWEQVAAPYMNPTRQDFADAITDIIHPANHDAVKRLDYGGLVKLGQKIATYLIST
jgi:predicted GIY-YIG superfamily endonuclease